MLMLAAAMVAAGGLLLAFAAGQIIQHLKENDMASESNVKLAAAVDRLLAKNADLEAQIAAGSPDTAALADETAAEDAITAKIEAVVPAPAAEVPAA